MLLQDEDITQLISSIGAKRKLMLKRKMLVVRVCYLCGYGRK